MKARSGPLLVVGLVGVTAAVFGLVLTQTAGPGGRGVGVRRAAAACTDRGIDCLPAIQAVDTAGEAWNRDSLAGKVVLVNFWATWCKPCIAEIPSLSAVYQRHQDEGLVILGMLADNPDQLELARFAEATMLTYPVVRVDAALMEAFGQPNALPTTLFYDRTGHLAYRHLGPLTEKQLESRLAELLAE